MRYSFHVSKEHAWRRLCVTRGAIISHATACILKTTSGCWSSIPTGEHKASPPGLLGHGFSPHPSIFVAPLCDTILLMKACEAPMEIPSPRHLTHLVNRKHINLPSFRKNNAVCLPDSLPHVGGEDPAQLCCQLSNHPQMPLHQEDPFICFVVAKDISSPVNSTRRFVVRNSWNSLIKGNSYCNIFSWGHNFLRGVKEHFYSLAGFMDSMFIIWKYYEKYLSIRTSAVSPSLTWTLPNEQCSHYCFCTNLIISFAVKAHPTRTVHRLL